MGHELSALIDRGADLSDDEFAVDESRVRALLLAEFVRPGVSLVSDSESIRLNSPEHDHKLYLGSHACEPRFSDLRVELWADIANEDGDRDAVSWELRHIDVDWLVGELISYCPFCGQELRALLSDR